ncbi:acyl-CoA thioesterase [Yonghaparkia sp. Soil809]|uniref:acyl-CoA thioesterase n=1 Tax=Yonghaparkia sp. Soil809 TaxID=1736417 RepID=UPI0006F73FB7|nr:acyl-CoA thioesterase [Yonghaparkia sp. Soil809]KRF32905.1 acyl-CoA thioesterase [Yonghaparkia sp. Soil809]
MKPPADRITLQFFAEPMDSAVGGKTVAAGSVLEWIDKAGYACAVGWSASYCVTAYVGNVHFTRSIAPGDLVQAHARIVHTGRTSMQVLVVIESASPRTREFSIATHCILVFVAVDANGSTTTVPEWRPRTDEDRELRASAEQRILVRREIREAMLAQVYSDAGTAPRTVFRFLSAPSVANWGGKAHGGTVMRWIDEAAFACAAGWSSEHAVAVYSGGIQFASPIGIGDLVEVEARLIHTGRRSMHIAVHVRAGSPTRPHELALTTTCMTVFVDRGESGRAVPIASLALESEEDGRLDRHALDLVELRKKPAPIPPSALAPVLAGR